MTISHFKRWLLNDITDFDVFCNLRNSGIEITVMTQPSETLTYSGREYQFVGKTRWVEARTTTEEQETLLLLSCDKVTMIWG
jgi:sortase (surface protein transpeptidase)